MSASVQHFAAPSGGLHPAFLREPPMADDTPSLAAVAAEVESLRRWMADVARDTREGRDAALSIKATIEAHNLPAQIAALRGDLEKTEQGLRADIVNASGHARQEIAILDARLQAVEAKQNRADGATGLAAWLVRYAPWLASAVLGFLAAVGLKDKLPH